MPSPSLHYIHYVDPLPCILGCTDGFFDLLCLFLGGIAYSNAFFGGGTGPIYLDDVACTSNASKLLECSSRPILVHDCQHSADAGVRCEGKTNP